jgi:hypothetical protein
MGLKQRPVADASQSVRGHPPAGAGPGRVRLAGELLQSLLLRQEAYRCLWQPLQRRVHPPGVLSQAAVAQVIAQHLWDSGERSDTRVSLPRDLKDRIRRALQGEVMTAETLTWFIDAFSMTAEDAGRLRAALYDDQPGSGAPVTDTLRSDEGLPIPQRHRTIAVFERRVIGAARHAIAHHTTRAITARAEPVYFYPCRQFAHASAMTVLRGGRITARHEPPGSSPILEITLTSPLQPGQVTSLEYRAEFGPGSGIAVEYRQVAHARADNVDIVVQFDSTHFPRNVWWTVWDDYRGGCILDQEAVSLDADACAHRYVPYLENAAAGFRWDW